MPSCRRALACPAVERDRAPQQRLDASEVDLGRRPSRGSSRSSSGRTRRSGYRSTNRARRCVISPLSSGETPYISPRNRRGAGRRDRCRRRGRTIAPRPRAGRAGTARCRDPRCSRADSGMPAEAGREDVDGVAVARAGAAGCRPSRRGDPRSARGARRAGSRRRRRRRSPARASTSPSRLNSSAVSFASSIRRDLLARGVERAGLEIGEREVVAVGVVGRVEVARRARDAGSRAAAAGLEVELGEGAVRREAVGGRASTASTSRALDGARRVRRERAAPARRGPAPARRPRADREDEHAWR